MQNNFLDKYYMEFEDSEENKFVYTDIHKEYVSTLVLLQMVRTIHNRILRETIWLSFHKISFQLLYSGGCDRKVHCKPVNLTNSGFLYVRF